MRNCSQIDPLKEFYFVSVSEGISDYYAIAYFNKQNNSLGEEYLNYTKWVIYDSYANKIKKHRYLQYYRGFLFVNFTLSENIYPNLHKFIGNFCTKEQYTIYDKFIKEKNLN